MFREGVLTFREFAMKESLPLATVQGAVLEFLRGRDVDAPRMTQDVAILSPRASELAKELRDFLNERLHIAVRIRKVQQGKGIRVYQVQKPKNRHLVDLRPIDDLPPTKRIAQILVVAPEELIAGKVRAYHVRRGKDPSQTCAIWPSYSWSSLSSNKSMARFEIDSWGPVQIGLSWEPGARLQLKTFNRKRKTTSFDGQLKWGVDEGDLR